MKKLLVSMLAAGSLMVSACAPMLSALMTGSAAPPQAPAAVTNISRGAVDFALNSFDAALYGLDFAMDAGKLVPGSPRAKQIAAAGRKVMNFLGAVEAARDLGNSATYEAAFQNANLALKEFRGLISSSGGGGGMATLMLPSLKATPAARAAILDRADA